MRICFLLLGCVLAGAATGSGTAAYVVASRLSPSVVQASTPQQPVVVTASERPAPEAQVEPAVREVARVFAGQLQARVAGTLLAMSERGGEIEVRWSSSACDWTEMEVIDLIEAVHQEFTGDVRGIVGIRECAGTRRRYSVSGRSFGLYHDGLVSRPEVLRYLIEARPGA